MSSYLWKVTAKKKTGEIPVGYSVDTIKTGTNGKPTQNDIDKA